SPARRRGVFVALDATFGVAEDPVAAREQRFGVDRSLFRCDDLDGDAIRGQHRTLALRRGEHREVRTRLCREGAVRSPGDEAPVGAGCLLQSPRALGGERTLEELVLNAQ